MPCYSAVMDVNNPEIMMVGTEYGVYYTGNGGDTWTVANNGDMERVPVFDMRQQKRPNWKVVNSGVVYVGTHGRGVFKTDYLLEPFTGIDDRDDEIKSLSAMKVFPNPLSSQGTVQFNLGAVSSVNMEIYSLQGKLVKSVSEQRMGQGEHKRIRFGTSELSTGTYILRLRAGNTTKTVKFVKTE
jgi:hypothetical protein